MLSIIRSVSQLDVEQLQHVYGAYSYSDFYESIVAFFEEPKTYIYLWQVNGRYVSALRIEPFENGWLVAGLETALAERRKGYAKTLLSAVIDQLPDNTTVYSHIHITNKPSLAVHAACGFSEYLDYARLLDGSISINYYTYKKTTPMR